MVPPRPRVLVVEDDAALRKVLELRLMLEGFDVEVAEDGQAGLDVLQAAQPDVVITDLMMPRVDGGGFCHGARQTPGFEALPILLLTAHQRDAYVDGLLELGGIVFMAKPFDAPALVQTLRDLLVNALSAPQQELQAS
jgi:two-component system chemotaxis response regulator CheY